MLKNCYFICRLFKTWIGTENVSTIANVENLFNHDKFDLPCSKINIDQSMINKFERQPSANKELMGQSLLLAITFLDVCVYKNQRSLRALIPQNRKQ